MLAVLVVCLDERAHSKKHLTGRYMRFYSPFDDRVRLVDHLLVGLFLALQRLLVGRNLLVDHRGHLDLQLLKIC